MAKLNNIIIICSNLPRHFVKIIVDSHKKTYYEDVRRTSCCEMGRKPAKNCYSWLLLTIRE